MAARGVVAVWYVSPRGVAAARLQAERDRCAAMLARATPPEGCGDAIPVAPARGPQIAFMPRETVMTESGPRSRQSGWKGAKAVRVGDAFDVMRQQAENASKRRGAPAFVAPFTPGQEAAARDYAALVERVEASGMKCSSMESTGAGGGGRSVSEAVASDMARLQALRRRIGDGIAKDKLRPSKGGMRTAIRVRDLVDRVCLGGQTLAEVARACGWPDNGRVTGILRTALCAALDRMQGYDLARLNDRA